MWETDNRTAYETGHAWVRDKDGAHHWLVAVKATFDVKPNGELELADEQVPPSISPEFNGEDFASSIKYDDDLLGPKPGTDIIVIGDAIAPREKPVPELSVALRVGKMQKVVLVRGINVYHSGSGMLGTTTPRPFTRMPIVYEKAFGGYDQTDADPSKHRMDLRNPIGVGFATRPAHLVGTPGPNVVYPGRAPEKTGPAGFGVIASHWQPRLRHAGTFDGAWIEKRRPLLPEDYDERFAMTSPEDQRVQGFLRGGAPVEVVNMCPEGVLSFELPRIFLAFGTLIRGRRHEHRGRLATLVIEPNDRRVMLTWQSSLRVGPKDIDYVDRTVVQEKRYI